MNNHKNLYNLQTSLNNSINLISKETLNSVFINLKKRPKLVIEIMINSLSNKKKKFLNRIIFE